MTACSSPQTKKTTGSPAAFIDEAVIAAVIDSVRMAYPSADAGLLEKGIRHAASLWREEDGAPSEFASFVKNNYHRIRINVKLYSKR